MNIFTDIDLSPNIQKFLPLINGNNLFYRNYNLKHPSALYNTSVTKIENALKDFLEVYELFKDKNFEEVEKNKTPLLLKCYKEFLYCVREYLDDCFHIIKSFIKPPLKIDKDRDQCRWLKNNATSIVDDFFKNISDYKKYLDNSVNELKHNNAILGSIAFYNKNNSKEHCLGYFIANVVNGVYEPVEKIHPKFGKTHTGFSYKRDLIYNIFNIYNISEEIILLLKNKIYLNIDLLKPKVKEAPKMKQELFKKIIDIPKIYFPDEYSKPVPSLSLTDDKRLKLEYPSQLSIRPNRLEKVVITHSGDGYTRKFRIPYM